MKVKLRALLTGASGYIGSSLVKRLVADGWDVHIAVRPESNLDILRPVLASISVHEHDGSMLGMVKLVDRASPDVVFHLASLFLAQHKFPDVPSLITSNIMFGAQLLEAMDQAGVRYLINTGTSWQNYDGHSYNPVNLYAATKQGFEDIARFYTEACDIRMITLRLSDTYGPDDPRKKLMALLWHTATTGELIEMSPGKQLLDLVYIDDVIDSFTRAADLVMRSEISSDGEVFSVSSGQLIGLQEVFTLFSDVTGMKVNVQWGAREYRKREVMRPWMERSILPGWQPKVCLRSGIERIFKGLPVVIGHPD